MENLETLVIHLVDTKGNQETVECSILKDETLFSAKVVRQAMYKKITTWIGLAGVKRTTNNGCKIAIKATFQGLNANLKPIYFGGNRGRDLLNEQLKFFVSDLKEVVSGKSGIAWTDLQEVISGK